MNEVVCHLNAHNLFVVSWQLFALNTIVFAAIGGAGMIIWSALSKRTTRRNYHV